MALYNYDKGIILALPILFFIFFFIIPDQFIPYYTIMMSLIIIYELVMYSHRHIFGITGIQYLSIPSIMFMTFTLFIALPSIYITGISEHPAKTPYFISIAAFYILFPMGLFAGNFIRRFDKSKILLLKESIKKSKYDHHYYELLIVLFSVSIVILIIYLLRVDMIPLFELIRNPGNSEKFFNLREDALKILQMTKLEKYAIHWLRSLFLPMGIIGSLFLTKLYPIRKYKLLFITFLSIGIFVNTLTLEKSPLATIFLIIVAFFFLQSKKLSLWKIVSMLLVVLSGPILITYFIFYGREDIFRFIYITYFERLIIIPSQVLFYYFEYFPEKHDFLLGRSSQLFSWISQFGTFPVANYVAKIWWQDPFTTGSANANYLGNFWADFGYLGTLLSTPVIGFVSYLFYWKLLDVSNYSMNIVYVIISTVTLPVFTFGFFSSNFSVLFFTRGLFILLFLMFWLKKHGLTDSD
ncbi:MAG: hypothetical protein SCARUB_04499 [Candidatus Scalindua rubra]|uniref:Oligosaccharide repeat unit polymerase n=1 Tax=Candidatus Scalindua rubra TaxID=1872076 RepID=A0A1E3X404_9BACT|nr:MAG: hypothetical protein SCARUB_04499 [Candidatus Scalindua rubra]